MSELTVSVTGEGEVSEQPDQAMVHFSIIARHDDQSRVVSELSEKSTRVLESLEDEFGFTDEVKSQSFNIQDTRNRRRGDESPDYNFIGQHNYAVTVNDLDDVGITIDTVIGSGASEVKNVEFALSDETFKKCREEAIEIAVENARDQAEVAARAENLEIAGVSDMQVQRTRPSNSMRSGQVMEALSADDTSTEIENEDVSVNASVSVDYQMV